MKKAFTLAEVCIVLVVIGVLTAILLPVAHNSIPDENVLKFKKANSALTGAIRELVNSDEYYLDGNLARYPDGSLVESPTYFCETLSDILNVKEKNCSKLNSAYPDSKISYLNVWGENEDMHGNSGKTMKEAVDEVCRYNEAGKIKEIVLDNGIVIYNPFPNSPFGIKHQAGGPCPHTEENCKLPIFEMKTPKGFLENYSVLCVDIDGTPSNATVDDCVNECPFAYGIRGDGKILYGNRVDEWMKKGIQE